MKKTSKWIALLLALVMVVAMLPVSAAAAKTEDTPTWTVDKSKSATALTNDLTTVTLSLPSAEETLTSDIVFVLDVSSCAENVLANAQNMLRELEASQKTTNASINVAVVMFHGYADIVYPLTKIDENTEKQVTQNINTVIQAQVANKSPLGHGSNMPSGIFAAQQILAQSDTASSRKYVILVGDGRTYLYCHPKENTTGEKPDDYDYSTHYSRTVDFASAGGGLYEWVAKYYPAASWTGNFKLTDAFSSWASYLSEIESKRADYLKYDQVYNSANLHNNPSLPTTYTKEIIDPFVINSEESMWQAYFCYKSLVDSGVNCYIKNVDSEKYADNDVFNSFMNYLASIGRGSTTDFTNIKNDILYLLAEGAVTDVIGNDFDLVQTSGACPFVLTTTEKDGDKDKVVTLEGTVDSNNKNLWNFGAKNEATGKYPYTVEYKPQATGTAEQFVWTINVPVENARKVQLSYQLKLTNKKTAAGTYGVYDEYGTDTSNTTGVFTNESADLVYYSSNDPQRNNPLHDTFNKPSVTYTVRSTTPNPPATTAEIPTGLNGIDHIAYIIGRNGLAKPNATITRAEVASIFFRLLTDEMRQTYLTSESSFSDVKAGDWYNTMVDTLTEMGIIKGYADGTFRPNAPITRAEFAAIAARFDSTDITGKTASFTDIASSWAKSEIERTAILGWTNGYSDGSFRPNNNITRAEVATLVNRVLQRQPGTKDDLLDNMITWPDNMDTTAWYYLAIQEASNGHDYDKYTGKDGNEYEKWSKLKDSPDWTKYQK